MSLNSEIHKQIVGSLKYGKQKEVGVCIVVVLLGHDRMGVLG